jgi:hypothetical protein
VWKGVPDGGILVAMRRARCRGIDSGPHGNLAAAVPLAIALGMTGCFSDQGVVIEVDIGRVTTAKSVELYLGTNSCNTTSKTELACAGIAPPPSGSSVLRGDVWLRDALLPYTAEVKGHTATFHLRTDTPSMVPIVIAVGLSADGTGVGTATMNKLDVPARGARIVTTTLTEARPVRPGDSTTATEDRVLVWKKENPASSCVVVEHWNAGKAERSFVVPDEDPDCDDVPAPECNPIAWRGTRPAGASPIPDCFSLDSINNMPACMLGSHGCSETGTPTGDSCATQSTSTCVPSTLCGCTKPLATCIQDAFSDTMATFIKCTVPMRASTLDLCQGNQQTSNSIDLNQSQMHYASACDQPQIDTLSSLYSSSSSSSADFHGATMEISTVAAPCSFRIKWNSGSRALNSGLTDYGAVRIPAENNAALLIPIRFDFKPVIACVDNEPFMCTFQDANVSLWACAQ